MGCRVLAIESSCDETACALVDSSHVLSSVVSSQIEVHRPFGGVVPELASRHHLGEVVPVVVDALQRSGTSLSQLQGIAVTDGPGLVGALLVGLQMARGLSLATGLPLYGIHHMEGHIFSAFVGDDELAPLPFVPHVALLVSGGHTELVAVEGLGQYRMLGSTRDDAAGEAYDKVAKLLGLGYPGGPVIDSLAVDGDPQAHAFPRSMLHHEGFEFSFSGLKTSVLVHVEKHGPPQSRQELADLCASFQAAVVEVLVAKACQAVKITGLGRLHIVGGVAANRELRTAARAAALERGFECVVPPPRYCGDNAAMIAAAAVARIEAGVAPGTELHTTMSIDDPRLRLGPS